MNERKQFLRGVLSTAVEARSCRSWGVMSRYDERARAFDLWEVDPPAGKGGVEHRVDASVIERGIQRLSVPGVRCAQRIRGQVLVASATNGVDAVIDSESANVVIQVGLFGEIVYA